MPVDGVCQEQAAEEKNFGDQENPHSQRRSFLLLVQRLKLSVQLSGAVHSVLLFSVSNLRLRSRRSESKNQPRIGLRSSVVTVRRCRLFRNGTLQAKFWTLFEVIYFPINHRRLMK